LVRETKITFARNVTAVRELQKRLQREKFNHGFGKENAAAAG